MRRHHQRLLAGAVGKAKKTSLLGVFANFALAVVKLVAGWAGHSFALVADGVDSLADVWGSVVVYFGLRLAAKAPDARHPYGHGKAEPLAAATVAVSLVISAVAIILGSIHRIRTPHPPPASYTLAILAGTFLIKELLFRYIRRIGRSIESLAVRSDAWRHRSDAVVSAFAFVGISIALLGGPRWVSADPWAAVAAAAVISLHGFMQIRPAILELADMAPQPSMETRVRKLASGLPGVIGLDKCHVRKMGLSFYCDLQVIVKGDMTVREGHRIAHEVEDEILRKVPQIIEVLVHVEPEEELSRSPSATRSWPRVAAQKR